MPQTGEEVTDNAWNGIRILIDKLIKDGSFGAKYPEVCYDNSISTVGTDEEAFWTAMKSENPNLLKYHSRVDYVGYQWSNQPPTLDTLDMIEFCWFSVGHPEKGAYHDWFRHYELQHNVSEGRKAFGEDINRIFRRNGIGYELTNEGGIKRVLSLALGEALRAAEFASGDPELDRLLVSARGRIMKPDINTRQEALQDLWDAWERLKTIYGVGDKRAQTTAMLDMAADTTSSMFRTALETEAFELTRLGNDLFIRHSETTKEKLAHTQHIDYLFHRMFSIINLVLHRASQSVQTSKS